MYFYLCDAYLLPKVSALSSPTPSPAAAVFGPQVQVGQWWWVGAWPCGGPGTGTADGAASVVIANHGAQNGGRPALGTCTATNFGCPDGNVGSPMASVKGLFGEGGVTWCGEAMDRAGAASWMPAGLWLQCRFGGDGPALPVWVVVSARGSVGVELVVADVWVSFSSSAAPTAG